MCYICLFHPVICSRGNTRKNVCSVSLFFCQEQDFTEETTRGKIKQQSHRLKDPVDSLILKDISTSSTPLSLPPTFIWAHPALLYRSQLQRASHNSISAAYEIGNHVSPQSCRDWSSLWWKLGTSSGFAFTILFFFFFEFLKILKSLFRENWLFK